jgi:hypothetical protein
VNYLLNTYAPAALAAVANDTTVSPPAPRAADFYRALATAPAPWARVSDIRAVTPGALIAYTLPPGSTDTGHVMVAIDDGAVPLTVPYAGRTDAVWVHVADSSVVRHTNDTRCPPPACRFATGVGRGYVAFQFTAGGAPVAFSFCTACAWNFVPIAVAAITG